MPDAASASMRATNRSVSSVPIRCGQDGAQVVAPALSQHLQRPGVDHGANAPVHGLDEPRCVRLAVQQRRQRPHRLQRLVPLVRIERERGLRLLSPGVALHEPEHVARHRELALHGFGAHHLPIGVRGRCSLANRTTSVYRSAVPTCTGGQGTVA